LLLSHTDVVLAAEPNWEVPPFSGEVRDGFVWGRGALDMKGQVAANAVAIASLAREGFQPSGELVFAATADEEIDTGFGLSWLSSEHPDAVRCDYAINEGGGDYVQLGGRQTYVCASAEKRSSPFLLRVHGQSGHAAYPSSGDNALVKAAALIAKLGAFRPEPRLEPEVEAFFAAVDGTVPAARDALARAQEIDPLAALLIEPVLGATFTPSVISASQRRNVIPGVCEVEVDCRVLPGQTAADAESLAREVLGEGDYELVSLESKGGTRSPLATPLWDVVESFVAHADSDARVVPIATAGFTDSHWLREAFGTVAYGFFPSPFELSATTVHSANERIPVADLELGVKFLRYAAQAMLG
jgi:acetylornithine deacetylase/succinyl-diaminopimelate desuccinylase-like protein